MLTFAIWWTGPTLRLFFEGGRLDKDVRMCSVSGQEAGVRGIKSGGDLRSWMHV